MIPSIHVVLASLAAAVQTQPTLGLAATIKLPGVEGRIDHLAFDAQRRKLFVAALGNNSLEVLDLDTNKRLKSVPGLEEPQGVLYLQEEDRVVVACGGSGELAVFHAGTLDPIARVKVGADADNVRWDPMTKFVYVGYGDGGLAIVDAKTWKTVGEIPLAAHPESFQFDARSKHLFVNLPSKRLIAVVDVETRKVIETWPVREAEGNFPMAMQGADRRLFVACRQPARLLVFEPSDGHIYDSLPLSGDADDVFLDEACGRLFVSCGAGSIDLFDRTEKGAYLPVGKVETAPGARTCLYSPTEERLYLAVPRRGDRPAEIRVYVTPH